MWQVTILHYKSCKTAVKLPNYYQQKVLIMQEFSVLILEYYWCINVLHQLIAEAFGDEVVLTIDYWMVLCTVQYIV